ncbi:MAG: hypothetical protein GYB53_17940, partial [Rhodobacteraceae bacterium]|nr:hypothetical protein [Paracoccaceae bacterium]
MALTLANRLSLPAILGRAPHWLAQNAVARKALWYADFRRGQFARNGLARGFPQMGSFSSAGMRYEQTASGLLVPRGVDEPRLADYSTGARRLLMEGPKSKEPIVSIPAEVTTGNPATWNATSLTDANLGTTLAPDGEAEVAVWNMQNRAVYWQVSGLTVGLAYTQSVWVKCSPEGIGETLYLRKPGVVSSPFGLNDLDRYGRITLDGTWQRITATRVVGSGETTFNYLFENRLSQGASGTGYGLAIWGANLEEGAHATSVVHDQGSGAARAPDLFAADVSGFDLSGGFWVSLNCRAEVTAGEDQALLRLAGSGG